MLPCGQAFRLIGLLAFLALILLAPTGLKADQEDSLRLCAGQPDGWYHDFALQLQEALSGGAGRISVIPTEGTLDNLNRLRDGLCDAALSQGDALFLGQSTFGLGRLKVEVPVPLQREYLHLMCRTDSGIKSFQDLLRRPEGRRVVTAGPGSGSFATWRALSLLEDRMKRIRSEAVGGDGLAASLTGEDRDDCVALVARVGTEFILQLERDVPQLRLVPFDLLSLNDAEDVYGRIFTSRQIARGSYSALQSGFADRAIETVAVQAYLVIGKQWGRSNRAFALALRQAAAKLTREAAQ